MIPRFGNGLRGGDGFVESRSNCDLTRGIRHVMIQLSGICVRKGDAFGKMSMASSIIEYILVIDKMNKAALLV